MNQNNTLSSIAVVNNVSLKYKDVTALNNINIEFPSQKMIGIIGPDGVGKSSLLSLIAGARKIQSGQISVLDKDMSSPTNRESNYPKISYMPQGLGKNLYPTLSVFENVDFFARLFDLSKEERIPRIEQLLKATGLFAFTNRPAGKLSGGMKQKLSLCCSLIHNPKLLILDEPTTGVDPLSRKQFWILVNKLRTLTPDMSVIVATAYMEEASSFDWLVMMNEGKIIAQDSPVDILTKAKTETLEEAYISFLPDEQKNKHTPVTKIPLTQEDLEKQDIVIEARDLTMKFGDFTAVNKVNFKIKRGEIYGFLGSNGCGKTTTMKMLTGLIPASSGEAFLFGRSIQGNMETKKRVGFMTQSFSLYPELTVKQNLVLHARLFSMPESQIESRIEEIAERFELENILHKLPMDLPLGQRQRLSLGTALLHHPNILILDEPTSGVDPVARDQFWRVILKLSREEKVTIFISTHFMNEALRCDRIALMHAGMVLETGSPEEIIQKFHVNTLEDAFNHVLTQAGAGKQEETVELSLPSHSKPHSSKSFSLRRLFSYSYRESIEIIREPIRLAFALLGSVILLSVVGTGISMDVENLAFAVLDQDQSSISRDYVLNLAGSRYFTQKNPLISYDDIDKRLQNNDIGMALVIPPEFEKNLYRGSSTEVLVMIDGALPMRSETISGYAQGMHQDWLKKMAKENPNTPSMTVPLNIDFRYRYNPDVKSIVAIIPALIPILLMLIPAILSTLSVVREKELGSIVNLYVTPVSKTEFLVGKQIPYIIIAVLNFIILIAVSRYAFHVQMKGNYFVILLSAIVYVCSSTGIGLLISAFTKSQISAILATALITILPSVKYSGLLDPLSSLEGIGLVIGQAFPTTHFLTISQGIFAKALTFPEISSSFWQLLITAPIIIGLGILLLKKQEN